MGSLSVLVATIAKERFEFGSDVVAGGEDLGPVDLGLETLDVGGQLRRRRPTTASMRRRQSSAA